MRRIYQLRPLLVPLILLLALHTLNLPFVDSKPVGKSKDKDKSPPDQGLANPDPKPPWWMRMNTAVARGLAVGEYVVNEVSDNSRTVVRTWPILGLSLVLGAAATILFAVRNMLWPPLRVVWESHQRRFTSMFLLVLQAMVSNPWKWGCITLTGVLLLTYVVWWW